MGRIHHPALYATEKPRFTMRMVFPTFRSSIPIEFRPVLRYRRMDCRPEYGTLKSSRPSGSFLSYQKAPTASIAQCPFRITGSDSSLQKKKERRSKRRSFCTSIAPLPPKKPDYFIWAATSSAKLSWRFSRPSPISKRTKRRMEIFSPILAVFSVTSWPMVTSGSLTKR